MPSKKWALMALSTEELRTPNRRRTKSQFYVSLTNITRPLPTASYQAPPADHLMQESKSLSDPGACVLIGGGLRLIKLFDNTFGVSAKGRQGSRSEQS